MDSIDDTGGLLCDYAAELISSGATCIRLEKNVRRMALRWGVDVEIDVMPRHVHLAVKESDGPCRTFMTREIRGAISYSKVTRLSRLSWQVADDGLTPADARARFEAISRQPGANRWWILFAASIANAAFCRLFGGDATAMAAVFVATAAGIYLRQLLLPAGCDVRLAFVACAFVSSVLASGCKLFSLGMTPDTAIATSVLYLVPGIPFLNAFSDLTDGHYVSFFTRLTDALVLTCCLSAGLCIGMRLMGVGMF
ncbi:MAG: threonine/serine exporter family protein [Muribaculaceae bacterium]|nr:threonine/serine exporter family protein [Muribaculaceae bacterium]